jgi:hypothetical protein
MNYLLSNRSTSSLQTLSKETWSRLLSLARFYGWQPMGTLPPFIHDLRKPIYSDGEHGAWDGTYLRNEGQVVRAEDAVALAGALQMSLDDIPDVDPDRELTLEDDLPGWLSPEEKAMIRRGLESTDSQEHLKEQGEIPLGILPFEYFAGAGKQNLVDFIRFCLLGEFVIS